MCELALQLPNSFVDIDRDEMEYVDGGMTQSIHWWGNQYKFSEAETRTIVQQLGWGAAIGTLASEFGLPTIVAAVLAVGWAYVDWADSTGGYRGVSLMQNWVNYIWIEHN